MAQDSRGDEAPSYPVPLPYGVLRWWSGCKVMTFQRNTQDFRQEKIPPRLIGSRSPCLSRWKHASMLPCLNEREWPCARPPLAPDELWCAKPSTNYNLRWFRGSCHELSCQLSRTIVPVVTNYRANCHGSLQNAGTTFIFRWGMVSSDENG